MASHTAIDPFQHKKWKGMGIELLRKNDCLFNFTHIKDFSFNALPKLVKEKEKFGIIYIDGSHLFEDVFIDFYYTFLLLEKGGVVLFDDSADNEVNKVISYIRKNYSSCMKELDMLEYNPRKGWEVVKYRIARKFNKVQLVGFQKIQEKQLVWGNSFKNF